MTTTHPTVILVPTALFENRVADAKGETYFKLLLFRRFVTLDPLPSLIPHFRLPAFVGLRPRVAQYVFRV
jgi:hypothetical protein